MACRIENIRYKGQGIESKLGNRLLEIFNQDDDLAKDYYDRLSSDDFKDMFGNWITEDIEQRTNEDGEPLLITEKAQDLSEHHYFILKDGGRYDLITREFSSFTSPDLTNEIKEITEQIAFYLYKKNFNEDFEKIDNSLLSIDREIENFVQERKAPLEEFLKDSPNKDIQEVINLFDNILKHKDEFKTEIIKFFRERKINVRDSDIEMEDLAMEEGLQGGDLVQSFEKNSKDNATANVKLMLSFLPRINNITGEPILGDNIGEPLFRSFDSIHGELQRELSDITNMYIEGDIADIFQLMKSKVEELAISKKSYGALMTILNNIDENKKTEFIQAFNLSRVNFYSTIIEGKEKITFRTLNVSNVNNSTDKNLNEYYVNFKNNFVENNTINKPRIKVVRDRVESILKDARQNKRKLSSDRDFYDQFEKKVTEFKNILEELGISTITEESLDVFLKQLKISETQNAYTPMYAKFTGSLINLKSLLTEIMEGKFNPAKSNPFKHYSTRIFNMLSDSENYFKENLDDSTLFSNDRTYWLFKRPSYLNNRINNFKKHPKLLTQLLATPYGKSSLFAKKLLGEEKNTSGDFVYDKKVRENLSQKRLDSFEISIFNSFSKQGESKDGDDNKSISMVDQLADRMNKVLRAVPEKGQDPIYPTITPADKSIMHEIKIDHFIKDTISRFDGRDIKFSDEVLSIFTDYVVSEIDRMKLAFQEINTLPHKELRVYYHTDESGNIKDPEGNLIGNAFKMSNLLPELDFSVIEEGLNEKLKLYNSDGSPKFPKLGVSMEQRGAIRKVVNLNLQNRVQKNVREMVKKGLFKSDPKSAQTLQYLVYGIDKRIINEYSEGNTLTEYSAQHLISDYTVNSIIANIEYTKLFTGDPAYYKNMMDFFKRVPATYTDGTNLRLGITPGDDLFDVTIIKNVKLVSRYIKEIEESLKNIKNLTKDEKDYILESYRNVNQTDAQGWITPKRWFFLISRLGKWNPIYQSVYNKINKGESLTPSELKFAAQPLKGVYFGVNSNVPVYLKYSSAVLLPQLVKGTQLESLYNTMVSDNIDEAIVLDGAKVGANIPNNIVDENGTIIPNPDLSILTLNNMDWKLQQDLPVKTIKPTLLGSQIQKNIYSSLSEKNQYPFNNIVLNGKEMYEMINDVISSKSNLNIGHLSSEIGKSSENVINERKLYRMLERELLDRKSPVNLLKSVQKNLPIEAIPGIKDKLYNILFSKVRKSAVKLNTTGGSFIQVSNFGLDKLTADEQGITWLVEPSELRPPIIEQDAEGKKHIVPGQIFIAHSQISKYIPDYKELAKQGKLNAKLDPRMLRAIGYRIPNQGQSSNDPLQIAGILPEGMGDTVVAYTEITMKTGSDFDIDKMYVMLPSIDIRINDKNFKNAKKYIRDDIRLTVEEMFEELENTGYDMTSFADLDNNTLSSKLEEAFIKEHVFDPNSSLEYHQDFMDQFDIGNVNGIGFVEYNMDMSMNDENQLNNMLFDLYWSILVNESTYGDLITPIDFPHIKNKIKELFGDNSKQTGENFKFYDPFYQLDMKFNFTNGKAGVGITANMLVDHNRSKFNNMNFNQYNLGAGHMNEAEETVFDKEYSEELNDTKYKIRDTISAFLNAFVDNAKDPYINDGNFNIYTSSVAFMLARAGVHPDWIVSFIGQPVLKDLYSFVQTYESKVIPRVNTSQTTLEAFKNTLKNVKDIEIVDRFKEFQDKAKLLNQSVKLSRFDTEGAGSSLFDMMSYNNSIKELFISQDRPGGLEGHFNKYKDNDGKLTSLGTQVNNTLVYLDDILDNNPSLFLLGSAPVRGLGNHISMNLVGSTGGSRGLLTNPILGELYFNEVYKFIMSSFPSFQVNGSPLSYIKDTINEISEYKKRDKEYDISNQNFFIDNLTIYPNSFGINNKNKSKEYKDRLYRSAYDLMIEDPILADKVFISSFLMNGFQTKLIDIKEYIPYNWMLEKGMRSFINGKNIEFKNDVNVFGNFFEQFVKNNLQSNILSPKIANKLVYKVGKKDSTVLFSLNPKNKGHQRYMLGNDMYGDPVFSQYIKQDSDKLFKLHSYNGDKAYYIRTNTLGFTDKESFLDIKEYSMISNPISSFSSNVENKKVIEANDYANENFIEERGYVPGYVRKVHNPRLEEIMQEKVENILFSGKNDVSLQEGDFTKDEC